MAVIVRGSVPAAEFALADVLQTLPGVEFDTERIVASDNQAVMPLLWVHGVDHDDLGPALDADQTVQNVTLLAAFDDVYLYRMEWIENMRLIIQMMTSWEATILDAYGHNGRWSLRVLYPDREQFSRTHEFCRNHGITFDVESIHEMSEDPTGRYGLTDGQYQALQIAARRGYFEVPRGISLEELADELDISHQALSERIRRGVETLIEETIRIGPSEEMLRTTR